MATLRMEYDNKEIEDTGFKACPFCGNEKLVITPKSQYDEICAEHGSALVSIECRKCHTEKKLYDIPDNNYWLGIGMLIGEWNRRV